MFRVVINVVKNVMGAKEYIKFRGKAIALHSQVIGEFCKYVGASQKVRQGLIRTAKSNGSKLGFLD